MEHVKNLSPKIGIQGDGGLCIFVSANIEVLLLQVQCIPVGQALQLYHLDGGSGRAPAAGHALDRPYPVQAEDVRPEQMRPRS